METSKESLKLTGPELQVELLKRMGYRKESRKCESCKHYTGVYNTAHECSLIPIIRMNVSGEGYCNYHKYDNENK